MANQTSLLSMIPAIEAARADEHGQFFSIAAKELRKLAEQSGQAADRIKFFMNHIQKEALTTDLAAESNFKEVQKQVETIAVGIKALYETVKQTVTTEENAQRLNELFMELFETAQRVISSITSINKLLEKTAADDVQVEASVEERFTIN